MKRIIFIAFSISILLASFDKTVAQSSNDTLSIKVDSLFEKQYNSNSPGMTILVVQNGEVILQRSYGMANLEYKVPITKFTVFDIASLSKQFTGMAISMLIEQGKISLQDDIRKYIPDLPDFGYRITVENLIHHTSGIRDWVRSLILAGWQMTDALSFEQILNMVHNQKELNFEPGSEYSYSNTDYVILAELVHRVTGITFRDWTDTNIFQPLGMKDTHFHDDFTEVVRNKAYGYERSDDGNFHTVNNGLSAYGSSSLFTTNVDLAKWIINFDNTRVGGKSVIERMLQCGILNNGNQISYAFGLGIGTYRGLPTINHSGSWASFNTFLLRFPEQHFSVVVLMNYSPSDAGEVAFKIADIYLATKLTPINNSNNMPISQSDSASIRVPSKMQFVDFLGDFKSDELKILLTVAVEDEKLVIKHWRYGTINLSWVNNDSFRSEKRFMQAIDFYRNDKGQVIGLKISDRFNKQEARSRNQRFVKLGL